jgi:hypothetical protein
MGKEGLQFIETLPGFAALGITPDKLVLTTRAFDSYII